MSRPAMLPLCLLLAGCGSGDAPPNTAPNQAVATPASPATATPPVKLTARTAEPAALPEAAARGAVNPGPVRGPSDPAWMRANLFPGATVTSSGRTAPDAEGLYATQILMTLPDGVTRDACVETLTAAVAKVVPSLERKDGPEDRVTLTGSNEDYAVTLVCGTAKEKMSAYLSYRWLRPPPPPAPAKATGPTEPAPTTTPTPTTTTPTPTPVAAPPQPPT